MTRQNRVLIRSIVFGDGNLRSVFSDLSAYQLYRMLKVLSSNVRCPTCIVPYHHWTPVILSAGGATGESNGESKDPENSSGDHAATGLYRDTGFWFSILALLAILAIV